MYIILLIIYLPCYLVILAFVCFLIQGNSFFLEFLVQTKEEYSQTIINSMLVESMYMYMYM